MEDFFSAEGYIMLNNKKISSVVITLSQTYIKKMCNHHHPFFTYREIGSCVIKMGYTTLLCVRVVPKPLKFCFHKHVLSDFPFL